jgi:predicted Zn-dependent protease
MSADWFRGSSWDRLAQEEFERRLNRARSTNRPQYLRIKAIGLSDSGQLGAAKELLNRVVRDYPKSLDCRVCLELLGDIARKEGSARDAENKYREVLQRWPDLNARTGMVEVSLAEVLTERGQRNASDEALGLLDSALKRGTVTFNSQFFRWNIALVRIAGQLGDAETVERAARTALSPSEPRATVFASPDGRARGSRPSNHFLAQEPCGLTH